MRQLKYTPGEKLSVSTPVDRLKYITNACTGKNVLDLGCYDETALIKRESGTYLFGEISKVAKTHIGLDNAATLPEEGITFSPTERILKADIRDLNKIGLSVSDFDVIVAGELIEHLPNTAEFFSVIKETFPGSRLICSTPNATSLTNCLLALSKKESCHIDHLQIYSFKTLNTLCIRAGFREWKIIPYHVKFTEMILRTVGLKKFSVVFSESLINMLERLFPLGSGGVILDIEV